MGKREMDDVDKLLYDNIGEARDIWIRESTNEYIMYEHIFSARFRIMMRKLINKNLPPRMKRMYYVKSHLHRTKSRPGNSLRQQRLRVLF